MKENKYVKLFICINIILISIIIIAAADATTTDIKKTETITIKTRDKNTAKQIKKDLDNKVIQSTNQNNQ